MKRPGIRLWLTFVLFLSIRVSAAVIVVPVDQPTIQAGIDAGTDGDTVLVASGLYAGEGNQSISISGKNIVLRSESGRDNTSIGQAESVSTIAITGQYVDTTTIVDGFTVVNGSLTVESSAPKLRNLAIANYDSLIGIRIISSAGLLTATIDSCSIGRCAIGLSYADGGDNSPVSVANCTFSENGCGIESDKQTSSTCKNSSFVNNTIAFNQVCPGSSPNWGIDSCTFDGNQTALKGSFSLSNSTIANSDYGIMCDFSYYATIHNCLLENINECVFKSQNSGIRGKDRDETLLEYWGNIIVSNSTISNNPGDIATLDGLFDDPVAMVLDSCRITSNGGGIKAENSMYLNIIKCVYNGNGGSIYYEGSGAGSYNRLTITGSIIANNDSGIVLRYGFNPQAAPFINNNIIWNNTGVGFDVNVEYGQIETPLIAYSDVFNNSGGNYYGIEDQTGINGNISDDPLFVDFPNGDYRFQCPSPCVDAGNPDSLDADGTRSDMGIDYLPHYFAPTPTAIIGPPDDSEIDSLGWLTWLKSTDADTICNLISYHLQIDEDPNFGSPEVDAVLSPELRLFLDETISYQILTVPGWLNLSDDSTYFWRVNAIDEIGDGTWTDGRNHFFYNIGDSAPLAPADGFSPSDGEEVISLTPLITWNPGTDPDDVGNDLRYAVRLSLNEDFTGFVYCDTTDSGINQIQPIEELADNSHYFYGVMTIDDEGLSSGWSETQNFWTNHYNFPPEPFPIYSPQDSIVQVVYYTHFTWGNTVDYDPMSSFTFTFEYSTNDQFENPVISIDSLTETTFTIETDSLAFMGSNLFWRAKAIDDDGLMRIGGIPDEEVRFMKILPPGDANSSGIVNIADVIYLFSFLRGAGDPPDPLLVGDVNGNCLVNVADVVDLFGFLKGSGQHPIRGDCQEKMILIEKPQHVKARISGRSDQ